MLTLIEYHLEYKYKVIINLRPTLSIVGGTKHIF